MIRLAPRDKRALVMGASIVIGALLVGRGLPAWIHLQARLVDEAAFERKALKDARAVIASMPALRDSLSARTRRARSTAPSVLVATSSGAAVSRLSAIVGGAARDAGLEMNAISLHPDTSSANELSRPSVRAEARGDISGLMQFLLLIETGPPLMRFSRLSVTQSDPGGAGRGEELRISLAVQGVAAIDSAATRPEARRP